MRPLLIDDIVRQKVAKVIGYSERNILSMDDLLDIYNKQEPMVGDRPEHICIIPMGYRVVFNLEKQNIGVVKHISVSVNDSKSLPSVEAVREIMKLFGMETPLEECVVKMEGEKGTHQSINIIET